MQPSCLGHRPIVVAVAKTSETSDIDSKTLFKTRRKNNHFFYTASSFNRKKTTFVSFVLSLDSLYTPSNIRVLVLEIGFWEKNTRRRKKRSFSTISLNSKISFQHVLLWSSLGNATRSLKQVACCLGLVLGQHLKSNIFYT